MLTQLENEIMDNANTLFIIKYHGEKTLKECLIEAITVVTKLTESQYCGFLRTQLGYCVDFDAYINFLYEKMLKNGAKE